ncbi:uncharacterized protein BDW47DRAFT_122198 [Aspergillus candidus]|uniref:Fatty acid desaturase domain-containing protein n=1 Tax=Aspergillus candidus TaxID=41067 RepID=A0A2I2FMA5_ASPCN|nr:hypothetical protein BDW47DRAFT_122198 [Aspergillus candidus]PLB41744.1 hypothetical protein BDW47DRAFT_122198 [Aspergillus candidus]
MAGLQLFPVLAHAIDASMSRALFARPGDPGRGLAFLATAAVQKDIIWWVRHHCAHHRYLDTPQDPYDASKGFLWSHIGGVYRHFSHAHHLLQRMSVAVLFGDGQGEKTA